MAQTHEQLNPFEQFLGIVCRATKQRDTHGFVSVAIKGLEGTPYAPPADPLTDLVLAWKVRQGWALGESKFSRVVGAWSVRRWGRRNGHWTHVWHAPDIPPLEVAFSAHGPDLHWTHVWHAPDIPPQRHRSTFLRCPSLRQFHRLGDPVQLATLAGRLRVVDGDVRGEPAEHAEAERERDDLALECAEVFRRDDVAVFQLADLAPGPGRGDGRVVARVSFKRLAPVKPRRVASPHSQPTGGLTLEPSQHQHGCAGEEVGQTLGHE